MSNRPSRSPHDPRSPTDVPRHLGGSVAYYRTNHELTFYLRALQSVRIGRLGVVLGLKSKDRMRLIDLPTSVRMILTMQDNGTDFNAGVDWFVSDPLQAVIMAMTGRQPKDGLILLFPTDWQGDSPELLLEKARCQLLAHREPGVESSSD